jgi:hypothetical protein
MCANFPKPITMAIFYNLNKRNFTLLLLLIAIKLGFAQTTISGGNVFGHWPLSGSPYIINGSIQIPNDSTLTIDPGVTINFQGTYKFLINGRLLAIGTATDTIVFTAADTSIGWRGIRFVNTATTNDSSKIIYCKIEYGKATGLSPEDVGGGVYFSNYSKVVIYQSCVIKCSANDHGGGIYCENSSPSILNNVIINNSALNGNGGGILSNGGSPMIIYNTISYNSSRGGGGITCVMGIPIISNNIISNNNALIAGGGIYFNSYGTITKNDISNNTAGSNGGGGIYSSNSLAISNNIISNNTASLVGGGLGGGGIHAEDDQIISNNVISNNSISGTGTNNGGGGIHVYNYGSGAPTLVGNIISNNTASVTGSDSGGGGIYFDAGGSVFGSNPILTNNTIVNNNSSNGGGVYFAGSEIALLNNCIVWGNNANLSGAQLYLSTDLSDPNFYYCNIQGGSSAFGLNNNFYTGIYQNNIDTDPMFVSPSGGSGTGFDGLVADWSLQAGSPCIDAGNPTGTYVLTDIAGNPRVAGAFIDMGAYESPSISTNVSELAFTSKIKLYPNPSSGNFKLNTADGVLSKIEIVDLLGKVVYSKAFQQQNSNNEIELSNHGKGVYFAKYTISSANQGSESVFTEKIVIQ